MASPTNTKVNIFFEAAGGTSPTGWTETFYMPGTSLQQNLNSVVQQYVSPRASLLGMGARIQSIRVSHVAADRQTFIQFMSGKQGQPDLFTTSPQDDYDPTQVDLLLRIQDAIGKRRQFWLGGLPDSVTDQLVQQGVTGAFVNSPVFKQWSNAITGLGFQIQSIAMKGPPPVYSYNAINLVQPIMVRKRNRGRPFYLFRGRRLA